MKTQNKPELLSKEVTISDSFHLLPQCEEIKEYIEKKFKEDDVTQQYYFIPHNKRNVFMVLSLVLGGPDIPSELRKLLNSKHESKIIGEDILSELEEVFSNSFSWESNKTPINIFIDNMKAIQRTSVVYFLSQKLFPFISSTAAEELFQYTCKGSYMYGVKIRWELRRKNTEIVPRKKYQREGEKGECQGLDGNTYLVIFQEYNEFKVGMIKTNCTYSETSRHTKIGQSGPPPHQSNGCCPCQCRLI